MGAGGHPPMAARCQTPADARPQEAFFSVMFFLFDDRILETDWRFLLLSTLFTWVQLLVLIFSPFFYGWDVDWAGNK